MFHLYFQVALFPTDFSSLGFYDGVGQIFPVILVVVALATLALVVAEVACIEAHAVLLQAPRFLAGARQLAVGWFLLQKSVLHRLTDLMHQLNGTLANPSLLGSLYSACVLLAGLQRQLNHRGWLFLLRLLLGHWLIASVVCLNSVGA